MDSIHDLLPGEQQPTVLSTCACVVPQAQNVSCSRGCPSLGARAGCSILVAPYPKPLTNQRLRELNRAVKMSHIPLYLHETKRETPQVLRLPSHTRSRIHNPCFMSLFYILVTLFLFLLIKIRDEDEMGLVSHEQEHESSCSCGGRLASALREKIRGDDALVTLRVWATIVGCFNGCYTITFHFSQIIITRQKQNSRLR